MARKIEVEIIGDASRLTREFNKAARSAQVFNARITGSFKGLSRGLGFVGATAGIAGVGLAMRSTVNAAIDFESSFAGVRKTVDGTEPELKALAAGFREMSKEIPVSVNELNRIGEAAGQLGVRQSAILDFTRTVAALGVTTNLASDQAADALARIANITQLPQDEFDRLGSTVVELGNKLAATESEIVDFGLRIAAAGKIIGLTEAQTLAVAGAFTSVGVEAEAGGTAVSKVFISLANAVKSGGKQLDLFAKTAGQSTADFSRLFEKNTAGAFVSFVEGLKRVDESGGNVFQTLKDLGLTDVRLTRAFLSISQSGDLLSRSLDVGTKAWRDNNALTEEAGKRYATTASRLQVFKNRVNDLQITIGNLLVPALEDALRPLSEWLEKTENQKRVQEGATEAMKDARAAFDALKSVIGPLASAAQELNKQLGGIRNTVQLLLVAFAVGKLVNFATALTGIGTAAVGSTGRVNALRLSLLRLGAIAVITLGVEIILNREAIHEKVTGFLDDLKRKAFGIEVPVAPAVNAPQLEAIRAKLAALKGETDVQVLVLDKIIARLKVVDAQNLKRIQRNVGNLRKNLDGIKSKKVDVTVAQKGLDRILGQLGGIKNKTVEMKVQERGLKDLQLRLGQVRSKTVDVAFVERGLDLIQARLDNLSGRTIEIAVTTTELQRRAAGGGGGVQDGDLGSAAAAIFDKLPGQFSAAIDDALADIDRLAKKSKVRATKAFNNLMASLSRDLTAAGATVSEADNLRVLQQQLAAVNAQIQVQGRTKDLLDQQADISAQIVTTQRTIVENAQAAAQAQRDAAQAQRDLAELRAGMTKSLQDDLKVATDGLAAIRAQIKVEGATADLLGQSLAQQQKITDFQAQIRANQLQRRQAKQFEKLGLTSEGEKRTPGVGALKGRLANLKQQVKGTFLDTSKTRKEFAQIASVLAEGPKEVGKKLRAAILQMLNDISSAFEGAAGKGGTGEITRGGIRSTQKLIKDLGLTQKQAEELMKRNLGVSGRRGFSAFGFGIGGQRTSTTGGAAGAAGGAVIINGPITVNSNDPDEFIRVLQKKGRRAAPGRRGRAGGRPSGL